VEGSKDLFEILSATGLKKVEDSDRWADSFLVQEIKTIKKMSASFTRFRFFTLRS